VATAAQNPSPHLQPAKEGEAESWSGGEGFDSATARVREVLPGVTAHVRDPTRNAGGTFLNPDNVRLSQVRKFEPETRKGSCLKDCGQSAILSTGFLA
jgi:hypothetical protein